MKLKFSPIFTGDASTVRKMFFHAMPAGGVFSRKFWKLFMDESSCAESSMKWRFLWTISRNAWCLPRTEPTFVVADVGYGIRMSLDLSRLTDSFVFIFGAGENDIGRFAKKYCGEDSVILDVGANIGSTTLPFAAIAGKGSVHSFEPSPLMREVLQGNISLNRLENIVIHPFGLGKDPSRGNLVTAMEGNPGSAFFESSEGGSIFVKKLDDCDLGIKRLDFIKIDTEGFEINVLKGGVETIKRFRPFIAVEYSEANYKRTGATLSDLCEFFGSIGYHLYDLSDGGFRQIDVDRVLGVINFFAIPDEKSGEVTGI